MSRNWLRSCSLTLSGGSSRTITGGGDRDLRITFEIAQSTIQAPNQAHFRIWNPSPQTISQFKNKEFTELSFSAGYQDNVGLIYKGNIKQSFGGKLDAVDGFLDIFCGDGDTAYLQARVTKTLQAGYTPQDKVKAATDAMAQFGVTLGTVTADLSKPKFPRGIPLTGMARDILRSVALSVGATWSIQNGQVKIIDPKKPPQGSTLVLNSQTGMIGIPTQTENGVLVRSLINPALQVDTIVHIDQNDINQAEQDNNSLTGPGSQRNFNLANTGVIAADGQYRVIFVERSGDTRGLEWYDLSTCIAVQGGSPNAAELQAGATKTYLGQS